MSSLKERVSQLEGDLRAVPMRISAYHNLPFAILRYDPRDEWELRREARHLATRLSQAGREAHPVSLAELLWAGIDRSEGLEVLVGLERSRGFEAAQAQVTTYLSDPDWSPLPDMLEERLRPLDPGKDVAFLLRAPAMAPAVYHLSRLLDEMQGRTQVPTILFFPGSLEGTNGLRFMDLAGRESTGNYRMKIYG